MALYGSPKVRVPWAANMAECCAKGCEGPPTSVATSKRIDCVEPSPVTLPASSAANRASHAGHESMSAGYCSNVNTTKSGLRDRHASSCSCCRGVVRRHTSLPLNPPTHCARNSAPVTGWQLIRHNLRQLKAHRLGLNGGLPAPARGQMRVEKALLPHVSYCWGARIANSTTALISPKASSRSTNRAPADSVAIATDATRSTSGAKWSRKGGTLSHSHTRASHRSSLSVCTRANTPLSMAGHMGEPGATSACCPLRISSRNKRTTAGSACCSGHTRVQPVMKRATDAGGAGRPASRKPTAQSWR